jgi:pimeloyl-ACP methyl ester carboxylesterase/DNA-binding CsgD family transcriptional regulator
MLGWMNHRPNMSPTSQHVRFCTSHDGTRIAFAASGSGPPMVRAAHWLSHLDHERHCPLWGPWVSLLAKRHALIRYDGRGCGLSDRDASDFSLDRCVDDLEAVVDSCKIERFVLVGATIGGITALAYAARHPERVSHLVIVGGFAVGRMARAPTPELIEETALELKAIELGWNNDNPAFRQLFTSLFIPESTSEQARSLNDLMRIASSPHTAIKRLQPYHHVDLRALATQVRCPTLVFHSRLDARIPFEQGRALAALIPGARFVPLESRNHWVVNTEPAWAQFVSEFENFLPKLPSAAGPRTDAVLDAFTRRELEILELVAAGIDNRTIGNRLGISEKTVRNRVSGIFSKLRVNNRPQAIVWARDAGFGRKVEDI